MTTEIGETSNKTDLRYVCWGWGMGWMLCISTSFRVLALEISQMVEKMN